MLLRLRFLYIVLSQLIVVLSFLLVASLKGVLSVEMVGANLPWLFLLLVLHLLVSLLSGKYNLKLNDRLPKALLPLLRANFLFAALLSMLIIVMHISPVSRLLLFGTVALATMMEAAAVVFLLRVRNANVFKAVREDAAMEVALQGNEFPSHDNGADGGNGSHDKASNGGGADGFEGTGRGSGRHSTGVEPVHPGYSHPPAPSWPAFSGILRQPAREFTELLSPVTMSALDLQEEGFGCGDMPDRKAAKRQHRIYLSSPDIGQAERQYVEDAFDSNWIAPMGPHVDALEAALANYTGVRHAAVLSSGTAAIHLALIMLHVKPGDLVLCQSMTFSATANPIRYLGATPVFIDSEPGTWNICPNALEDTLKKLTSNSSSLHSQRSALSAQRSRPKAILPVHLYGMPARMDDIMEVAARYEVPVVEDAAEALGSRIGARRCGAMGHIGILSFNGNKIITTSGGGALLCDDPAMVERARFLATQARDSAPHYQHSQIGYNYRMSNVLAAIGRGQMEVIDDRVRQRRANYDFYRSLLDKVPGITFMAEPGGYYSNRWLSTILVNPALTGGVTRETIRIALCAANIESRPLWKPLHMQPVFYGMPFSGGHVAERLFEQGLCLPSGSNISDKDKERIAKVLGVVLKRRRD